MTITVPIDKIKPAKDNVRRDVGDVTALAANIASLGLLQPLLVLPADKHGDHLVVAGHRRLAACKLAGVTEVECTVRDVDRIMAMLSENGHRKDLTRLEFAYGFQRLVDEEKLTQRQIAERFGIGQASVAKYLSLLKLPAWAQDLLDRYQDPDDDRPGLTVRQAETVAQLVEHTDVLDELRKDLARATDQADVAESVNWAEKGVETKRRIAAHREQLADDGVVEIDYPANGFHGSSKIKRVGDKWSGIDMTPAAHGKLPCHAAAIEPHYGTLFYVCTKPAAHAAKKPNAARVLSPAEKKRRDEMQALRDATKARRERLTALLAAKPSKLAMDYIALQFLHRTDQAQLACELLGLDPAGTVQAYRGAPAYKDWRGALLALARSGPAGLERVATAVAAAEAEAHVDRAPNLGPSAWRSETIAAHMAYLEANGYALTPVERAKLGPPKGKSLGARKAARKAATTARADAAAKKAPARKLAVAGS